MKRSTAASSAGLRVLTNSNVTGAESDRRPQPRRITDRAEAFKAMRDRAISNPARVLRTGFGFPRRRRREGAGGVLTTFGNYSRLADGRTPW
jgi:hypothetical protein